MLNVATMISENLSWLYLSMYNLPWNDFVLTFDKTQFPLWFRSMRLWNARVWFKFIWSQFIARIMKPERKYLISFRDCPFKWYPYNTTISMLAAFLSISRGSLFRFTFTWPFCNLFNASQTQFLDQNTKSYCVAEILSCLIFYRLLLYPLKWPFLYYIIYAFHCWPLCSFLLGII